MTIKDIKIFLEQFDENEEVIDIRFEKEMDICDGCCEYYYDEYYEDCIDIDHCRQHKEHKNTSDLSIATKSSVRDEKIGIFSDEYISLHIVEES